MVNMEKSSMSLSSMKNFDPRFTSRKPCNTPSVRSLVSPTKFDSREENDPPPSIYIDMTKKEEKTISDNIVALLGADIKSSDYLLINELIDWIKISNKAKDELQAETKKGDSMNWQTLTSIAMASKQIQSIMNKLGITPQQRNRLKKKKDDGNASTGFDLNKFLNEN
jgi:hypothetical protein